MHSRANSAECPTSRSQTLTGVGVVVRGVGGGRQGVEMGELGKKLGWTRKEKYLGGNIQCLLPGPDLPLTFLELTPTNEQVSYQLMAKQPLESGVKKRDFFFNLPFPDHLVPLSLHAV